LALDLRFINIIPILTRLIFRNYFPRLLAPKSFCLPANVQCTFERPAVDKSRLRRDRGLRRPRGRFNPSASPAQPLLLSGGKNNSAIKASCNARRPDAAGGSVGENGFFVRKTAKAARLCRDGLIHGTYPERPMVPCILLR
jgi:hypothetical protein